MSGQVFGRVAVVINFHRVQRLVVAMVRRWLLVLCPMYYDDASLQDLAAAIGRGQRYIRALFCVVGLPLAEPKQVDLNRTADFLGMVHEGCRCTTDRPYVHHPRSTAAGKGHLPYPKAASRRFSHPSSIEQDSWSPRFPVHRRVFFFLGLVILVFLQFLGISFQQIRSKS